MTKAELAKLFGILSVAYPNFGSQQNKEMLVEVWFDALQPLPYELVEMAIKSLISTSRYAPSVAEVKETVYKQNTLHGYTFDEIWNLILTVILFV